MKTKKTSTASAGEPMVWFTSMGLAVGLCMVLFLLLLILRNGFEVFWPDRVAQYRIKDDSGNVSVIAGRIVKEQERAGASAEHEDRIELQIFTGNKDFYDLAFRFIDRRSIVEAKYPDNIMVMERLEYGDAVGFPKRLEVTGKGSVMPADPNFEPNLERLVEEENDRWLEIREIEKVQIGKINHQMDKHRIAERGLNRKYGAAASQRPEMKEIQRTTNELQTEYETLARKASELRNQQQSFLTYTIASGEEKRLPVGQIVHYYYPNRIGVFERIGQAVHRFWNFLSGEPREANTEGGIFPAIFGTFVMTLLLSIAVTPFGVLAAIYLREYAKQGLFVRSVRIAVNNLAGVPSIVFGVFGLGFFVYFLGGTIDRLFFGEYLPTPTFGTGGILWASLTLALMTVPVVIVATEEALAAVPRGVREGSLACGASKWQTIRRVVLPASATGILTGLILAMARGAGEVAPLMLVGVVKLAPSLPLDTTAPFVHLDQKFMHLGFHIYDLGFQSPDSEAAKPMVFATTFLLILLVVCLNLGAIIIRERLRRKYATSAF